MKRKIYNKSKVITAYETNGIDLEGFIEILGDLKNKLDNIGAINSRVFIEDYTDGCPRIEIIYEIKETDKQFKSRKARFKERIKRKETEEKNEYLRLKKKFEK